MIATDLYKRQSDAIKINNFENHLDNYQSELAMETLKDPYIFDFVDLNDNFKEKNLEDALMNNISKLLLELGKGFSFVGRQYHLEVAGEDFYIDLLFYNIKLRCYFVIELKASEFKPEFVGKLNFYLSAVDETIREKDDNPTIGLLLCKYKNNIVAEYSLRNMSKPIGVSQYKIGSNIMEQLPSTDKIVSLLKEYIK